MYDREFPSFEEIENLNDQLFEAVENEDIEKLGRLLQKAKPENVNARKGGDDVDAFFCKPLLHIAIEKNNFKICQMLLNADTDVTAFDATGNTALMCAASHASADIVKLLLEKISLLPDAEYHINGGNFNGQTALTAALDNTGDVIEVLIKAGAQIDKGDNRGYTPLMQAASLGKTDKMITLIKHGANYHLKNNRNETALTIYRNCYFSTFYSLKRFSVNKELKNVMEEIRNKEQQETEKLLKCSPEESIELVKNNKKLKNALKNRLFMKKFLHHLGSYDRAKAFYYAVGKQYSPEINRFIRQHIHAMRQEHTRS